ncbi:unnamed protein product, partial [Iphiclides podalirius]
MSRGCRNEIKFKLRGRAAAPCCRRDVMFDCNKNVYRKRNWKSAAHSLTSSRYEGEQTRPLECRGVGPAKILPPSQRRRLL